MAEKNNSGWGWGILLIAVLVWFLWPSIKPSETAGKWQATYYPDGCLNCNDKWIASPYFEKVNECIAWVETKHKERLDSVTGDIDGFRAAATKEGYSEAAINAHLLSKGKPLVYADAAECGFDCKMNYDFGAGVEVCKETVDVLGKTSF